MKIERINENQIRCTLTSFDLSRPQYESGRAGYGSEKARSLFREMIQKASNEVGFDAEDIPLMVEAIRFPDESVMLVITKIEDPEELDTRFSNFLLSQRTNRKDFIIVSPANFWKAQMGLMEFLKNDLLGLSSGQTDSAPAKESGAAASADGQTASEAPAVQIRIYRFGSLDQVTDAARIVNGICEGKNSLYKRPQTSSYYLVSLQRGLRSPDLQPSLQYSCRVWRKGKAGSCHGGVLSGAL